MIWPLLGPFVITSRFGWRTNPLNPSEMKFHSGLDLDQSTGSPVVAAAAGRVVESKFDSCTGNTVVIDHDDGLVTVYHHMLDRAVMVGSFVPAGRLIGHLGATGSCQTGAHLHFTIKRNGQAVDPIPMMPPVTLQPVSRRHAQPQSVASSIGLLPILAGLYFLLPKTKET